MHSNGDDPKQEMTILSGQGILKRMTSQGEAHLSPVFYYNENFHLICFLNYIYLLGERVAHTMACIHRPGNNLW